MTLTVTEAVLLAIAPQAKRDLVAASAPAFARQCPLADMATPLRLAHFLGQLAHESQGFLRLEENLNYSATRLMQMWPARFPTLELAARYAHQPEKIANFVYGGRLGNVAPGDGWRYRGRGFIMTTGLENYDRTGARVRQNLVLFPELLLEPAIAVAASIDYWMNRGLNHLADADDIEEITHKISGAKTGIESRSLCVERAKKAFGV